MIVGDAQLAIRRLLGQIEQPLVPLQPGVGKLPDGAVGQLDVALPLRSALRTSRSDTS
jgi:hypothetical protein